MNMDDAAAPFRKIAEQGGTNALSLVGVLMEQSARESEWVSNTVEANLQRQVDEWRTRALVAEARLERAYANLEYIIGG